MVFVRSVEGKEGTGRRAGYAKVRGREVDVRSPEFQRGVEEAVARGTEAEDVDQEEQIMAFGRSLTPGQWEGIRIGENTISWDPERRVPSYAAVPDKHPGFPVARYIPGRKQRAYEASTAARPQRTVAKDLLYFGLPGGGGLTGSIFLRAASRGALAKTAASSFGITEEMLRLLPHGNQPLLTVGDMGSNLTRIKTAESEALRVFGERLSDLNPQQTGSLVQALEDGVILTPTSGSIQGAVRLQRQDVAGDLGALEKQRFETQMASQEGIAQATGQPGVGRIVSEGQQARPLGPRPAIPPPREPGARLPVSTPDAPPALPGEGVGAVKLPVGERGRHGAAVTAPAPRVAIAEPLSEAALATRATAFEKSRNAIEAQAARQVTTQATRLYTGIVGKLKTLKIADGASEEEVANVARRLLFEEKKLLKVGNPGGDLIAQIQKEHARLTSQMARLSKQRMDKAAQLKKERHVEIAAETTEKKAQVGRNLDEADEIWAASERRERLTRVHPKTEAAAAARDASYKKYLEMGQARQRPIKVEAERLAGRPLAELTTEEMKSFVAAAVQGRGAGMHRRRIGMQQAAKSQKLAAKRARQPRPERGETVGPFRLQPKPKPAPEAPPRPQPKPERTKGGFERAVGVPSPEAALRSAGAAAIGATGAAVRGAGKHYPKFPLATVAGAAGAGLLASEYDVPGVPGGTAFRRTQREVDKQVAGTKKRTETRMADIKSVKTAEEKQAVLTAQGEKAQWYGPAPEGSAPKTQKDAPKNWLEVYKRIYPHMAKSDPSWAASQGWVTYQRMRTSARSGQRKLARAHAWRDFVNVVGILRKDPNFATVFDVDWLRGEPQNFDLDKMFGAAPKKVKAKRR